MIYHGTKPQYRTTLIAAAEVGKNTYLQMKQHQAVKKSSLQP